MACARHPADRLFGQKKKYLAVMQEWLVRISYRQVKIKYIVGWLIIGENEVLITGSKRNNSSLLFYCSFLLLQKRTKKRAPKSNTARFREAAMFDSCTTVASALVILLLGAVSQSKLKTVFSLKDTHT